MSEDEVHESATADVLASAVEAHEFARAIGRHYPGTPGGKSSSADINSDAAEQLRLSRLRILRMAMAAKRGSAQTFNSTDANPRVKRVRASTSDDAKPQPARRPYNLITTLGPRDASSPKMSSDLPNRG